MSAAAAEMRQAVEAEPQSPSQIKPSYYRLSPSHGPRMSSSHGHRQNSGPGCILSPDHSHRLSRDHSHRLSPGCSHRLSPGHSHRLSPSCSHRLSPDRSHRLSPDRGHRLSPDRSHRLSPDHTTVGEGLVVARLRSPHFCSHRWGTRALMRASEVEGAGWTHPAHDQRRRQSRHLVSAGHSLRGRGLGSRHGRTRVQCVRRLLCFAEN